MTKQELLNALSAKEQVLAVAQLSNPQAQPDGVNRYVASVKVQTADGAINYSNHAFYVENEGQAGEVAYWENSEPFPTREAVVSFQSKVETFINTKITDGTIKGAVVTLVSEANRSAFVQAVKADNAVITVLVTDANNDGNLELTITA